jgi:hypothetical protein
MAFLYMRRELQGDHTDILVLAVLAVCTAILFMLGEFLTLAILGLIFGVI